MAGWLEDHSIPHDQGRNQGGEGLIEGIVEGTETEGNPQWGTADLPENPLGNSEARRNPVKILEGIDGVVDVGDGAIELLLRIAQGLANLPHHQPDNGFPLATHAHGEAPHPVDALGHGHRRPQTAPVIVGRHRRREGRQRLRFAEQGEGADRHLLRTGRTGKTDGRKNFLKWSLPESQFASTEVVSLFKTFQTVDCRDLRHARGKNPLFAYRHRHHLSPDPVGYLSLHSTTDQGKWKSAALPPRTRIFPGNGGVQTKNLKQR